MAKAPTENRPDFENGAVGTGNDARLAMYDQIADSAETVTAADFEDVTDDMFRNPAGTGDDDPSGEVRDEEAGASSDADGSGGEASADDIAVIASDELAPLSGAAPRIKVNGEEVELTPEFIAHAQKIAAADAYLAEASKIYRSNLDRDEPSTDATSPEVDYTALARALQMGTEEEAAAAIKALHNPSLPAGGIKAAVQQALTERDMVSDAERFKQDYKDILADPKLAKAVWAFDREFADDGQAPTYERFKAAAEMVQELRGTTAQASGLDGRRERVQSSARAVVPNGARRAAPTPEPEETPRSIISEMAKSRGQSVIMGGR